jgi:hypothetical protein
MALASTRWAIPYPEGTGDTPDVPHWMHEMAVSLDDHAKDAAQSSRGSRPAASKAGIYHWSTDTKQLSRDNGSSWDEVNTGMEKISELVPSGSPGVMSFTSIPAIYRHLKIVGALQGGTATPGDIARMRFNNDSGGTSYAWMYMQWSNTQTAWSNPAMDVSDAEIDLGFIPLAASTWTHTYEFTIFDYRSTVQKRVVGQGVTGAGNLFSIQQHMGIWNNSAVINRIDFQSANGLGGGSRMCLYGMR